MEHFRRFALCIFLCVGFNVLHSQDNVHFMASQNFGCDSVYVAFNNYSAFTNYQGAVNYYWYLNGNQFANSFSPPGQMVYPGRHRVRLEARDTLGGNLGWYEEEINVAGPQPFKISTGPQACPNELVSFSFDLDPMYVDSAVWNFGPGEFRTGNWVNYQFASLGNYTVTLYLYCNNYCGKVYTSQQNISVTTAATPIVNAYVISGWNACVNDSYRFGTDGQYASYLWDFGDGATSTLRNPVYAFSAVGEKRVVLTATNICGQTGRSDTLHLIVSDNQPADAGFHFYPEGMVCPNREITFEAHGAGTWSWDFGDGSVSDKQKVSVAYGDTGVYPVSLVVTNGCGNTDTFTQMITVQYTYETVYGPIDFYFEGYDSNSDTLRICPGTKVNFRNTSQGGDVFFEWMIDGTTFSNMRDASYNFNTHGDFAVYLMAKNNCGGSMVKMRWVVVDSAMMPNVRLQVFPKEICNNEKVYFYDEMYHGDKPSANIYSIAFGDGQSLSGLQTNTNNDMGTLAEHVYGVGPAYAFVFTAVNTCGRSVALHDTIRVTNNPEHKTMYYISNSTQADEEPVAADWGTPQPGNVHRFVVPIRWASWQSGMSRDFIVYFWYGSFNPGNNNNAPDGMVRLTSDQIVAGDSVVAWVPINPQAPQSVGIAAAWYCGGSGLANSEPDVFGMPRDAGTTPVEVFSIYPGGNTNVMNITSTWLEVDSEKPWMGYCSSERVYGRWTAKLPDGRFARLEIEQGGVQDTIRLYTSYNIWDPYQMLELAGLSQFHGDSLEISTVFEGNGCFSAATYRFDRIAKMVHFFNLNDTCSGRMFVLANSTFFEGESGEGENRTACPGSPVKFKIAGGQSYIWHFPDATTSVQQFPQKSFATAGNHNVWVEITNGCGGKDTLSTLVYVRSTARPQAWFDIDRWDIKAGDTLRCFYGKKDFIPGSLTFLWQFGDGATSAVPNPTHIYTVPGSYQITLTVSNACGTAVEHRWLEVRSGWGECALEARFIHTVSGNMVTFNETSVGGGATVSQWELGDGNFFTGKDFQHTYSVPGAYTVCLTVFDSVSGCTHRVCRDIVVGNVQCLADFSFTKNDNTQTLFTSNLSQNALTYTWTFGDGKTSNLVSPVHIFDRPGEYEVCLNIANTGLNCTMRKCKWVQIGNPDSAVCNASFEYFVDGLTVRFTNTAQGNVAGGSWDFGDGTMSTEANPVHTYTSAGNYTVCASVWDQNSGCISSVCKTIQIGTSACKADFMLFANNATREVSTINKSLGEGLVNSWDFGDGFVSSAFEPSHIYPRAGIYTICLNVKKTDNSCSSRYCTEMVVADSSDNICNVDFDYMVKADSLRVLFNENSVNSFVNWSWDFGNGQTSVMKSPVQTYTQEGLYTVCLSATDASGCISTRCRPVLVVREAGQSMLSADFNYFVTEATHEVSFGNLSTGPVTEWYWTFGDGKFGTGPNPVHSYASAGVYPVCLSIYDAVSGRMDRKCQDVLIGDAPCTLKASFTQFIDHQTRKVLFADISNGDADSWFWSFGDGTTSARQHPEYTYAAPGYYLVTLSVRNTVSKCIDNTVAFIQVGEGNCKSEFTYMTDAQQLAVDFSDQSVGDIGAWFWTFGDGNYSTDANPDHMYSRAGSYHVGLTITGTGGLCYDYYSQDVFVGQIDCKSAFDVYADSASNRVYFTPEAIGQSNYYFWIFGDGKVSTATYPVNDYPAPGIYTAGLTIYNPDGNCADYTEKSIMVGSLDVDCEADFFYSTNTATQTVSFINTSIGEGLTSVWDFGDGDNSTETNPVHTYFDPGYYNVCLNIVSSNGNYNVVCKPVQVVVSSSSACKANFNFVVDSVTRQVKFYDASMGQADNWKWDFGDGTTAEVANPVHTFGQNDYYTVRLEVSEESGSCSDIVYRMVNVNMRDGEIRAGFGYEVDSTLLKGKGRPVDFLGIANMKSASYEWDFGDGQTNNTTNEPTNYYEESGYYTVCLTVEDPVAGTSDIYCEEIYVEELATSVEALKSEDTRLMVLPNPFHERIVIKFRVSALSDVKLELLDPTGRLVSLVAEGKYPNGDYTFEYAGSALSQGVYYLRYTEAEKVQVKMLIRK